MRSAVPDPSSLEHGARQTHSEENTIFDQQLLVYPKVDHAPATYTVLDDIEAAVDALAERGVAVMHYSGTATDTDTDEKGIFRVGDIAQAWFTDPAGNILSVMQVSGASDTT